MGQAKLCFKCASPDHLVCNCPKKLPSLAQPTEQDPEKSAEQPPLAKTSQAKTSVVSSPLKEPCSKRARVSTPPTSDTEHLSDKSSTVSEMSSQNYTPELFSSTSETSTEPAKITSQAATDKPPGSTHTKCIEALSIQGKARRTLIKTLKPAHLYYKARALYLQYKSGNFTKEAAQHWAANEKEIAVA